MAAGRTTKRQDRIQRALEELKSTIRARYPDAQFELSGSPDDPRAIHLDTIVDIEDLDQVKELTIEREIELQLDERLPIHVIPLWPKGRSLEELRKRQRGEPNWIDGTGGHLAAPD